MYRKNRSQKIRNAVLVLEDGSYFMGKGFGSSEKVCGEVVFSTSMMGYTESLTDPSYHRQILTLTYPLIGNYGVAPYRLDQYGLPIHFESVGIKVAGLVVQGLCFTPHHWASERTLHQWFLDEQKPGIYDIDTRRLTKKLRERGVMLGILDVRDDDSEIDIDILLNEVHKFEDPNRRDLVGEVTINKPLNYDIGAEKNVVLIDCGVKASILRNLLIRNVNVKRLPYNFSLSQIMQYKPSGVVISNGPGDPKNMSEEVINAISSIIEEKIPVMGICLGNQILSLALGGDTYKLKYGHRSQNQPSYDLVTSRCYITTQNHGYATEAKSLDGTDLEVWFINANDKTIEGIRHKEGKTFAVQWHPEASPGPFDTEFLFDLFLNNVR